MIAVMKKPISAMLALMLGPTMVCGSILVGGVAGATGTSTGGGHDGSRSSSRPCIPSKTSTAPANGLIADFSDVGGGAKLAGIEVSGKIVTYAGHKLGGPGSPTYTTTGGALNIRVSAAPTSTPQFLGAVVSFNNCIDASAFVGVQFTISGSFSGCTMQYATGDVEHQDVTMASTFATGPVGSYPPQNRIAAGDLTSTPRTIKAPFVGSDIQGSPRTALDASKLIFTLWQFSVPVAAEDGGENPKCTGNITIDDIKFYR
jgi:hypothetical protein